LPYEMSGARRAQLGWQRGSSFRPRMGRKGLFLILEWRKSMLDLKFVRENPEIVKQNIRNKFQDHKLPLVDEVIELDQQSRKAKQEADALRADRKRISKQIGVLMAKGQKEEAEKMKEQVNQASDHLAELEKKEDELTARVREIMM